MADLSLDDLIKQDREKNKTQRTNVHTLLCRKPSKRKSSTNKDNPVIQNRTPINLAHNPTSLTSKTNKITSRSFKAKNSLKLRTPKGQKNSNRINQEKSLKDKVQNRKKSCSEP